jgi:HEAT repeat protein
VLALGGAITACCLLGLLLARRYVEGRNRRVRLATAELEPLLHEWLVFDADLESLRLSLRLYPAYAAFRSLTRLATQQVTLQRQRQLAEALRAERWVACILRSADSLFWWRRFDAARLLTVVGMEEDEPVISRLLADRSAAVRLVAIDAAARLQNRELIVRQLETLASHQDAVQAYQIAALSRQPAIVGRILRGLLVDDAPVSRLNAWIDAAGSLVDPEALERVRELASHRSADVRVHVARALRRLATPETQQVLSRLLEDEDWRVRAQSARALGALRCENAIAGLAAAVRDRSWWVRYRAALALAQVGGRGRTALLALAVSDDAMASDMSALVSELTSAAVVEMSEV